MLLARRFFLRCLSSAAKPESLPLRELDRGIELLGRHTSVPEYVKLLRQAGAVGCLDRAKYLHSHIVRHSKDAGAYLTNYVVEMYGNCGSVELAGLVFSNMRERNVFTWTIMIKAFARNGHYQKAVQVYEEMDVTPSKVTFICVLGACAGLGSKGLEHGRKVHARAVGCGLEGDLTLANTLINMYGKCGSIEDARAVFSRISDKDVVSWNTMIEACVCCGCAAEALDVYAKMKVASDGCPPNVVTYVSLLSACSSLGNVAEGKRVHCDIRTCGLDDNAVLGSKLVSMYSKCGRIECAKEIFERMCSKGVVSWNAMIAAYAQNGQCKEALGVFRRMELDGTKPDDTTFLILFTASCHSGDLSMARDIESRIMALGKSNSKSLGPALVTLYGRLGLPEQAKIVFCMHRSDAAAWNSMIAAYAQNAQRTEAVELFKSMAENEELKANEITFLNVLGACTCVADVSMVHEHWEVHRKELIGLSVEDEEKVANSLIACYARCNSLESAKAVFEQMQQKSAVSWSSMIAAYSQHGYPQAALSTYKLMLKERNVKPDEYILSNVAAACAELRDIKEAKAVHKQVNFSGFSGDPSVATAMVIMYAKCGDINHARAVFSGIGHKDVVVWSSMLSALVNCGLGQDALHTFRLMDLEGVKPNSVTFVSVIEACNMLANRLLCKQIDHRVTVSGYGSHPSVRTALITMHSKSGNLLDAASAFSAAGDDPLHWTAMINACGQHADPGRGLDLLQQMELCGVKPDVVTLLTVLSVCSHAGMVKQGWYYFDVLSRGYQIELERDHYACLVDLLARAGWLHEAYEIITNMPFRPDVVVWTSFLGACKNHGNTQLAGVASCQLVGVAADSGPLTLMANTVTSR